MQTLPLGLSATITIINKQASNVLIVPLSALRDLGDKNYGVFLVKNSKLVFTPVKVGLMDSVQAEITSGINEGDLISTGIVQGTGN
jgi:multidrug efflux pump subunit AcrA (membrane-fusion protein)